MARLAVLAVVLAGCDAVFGLTDVHVPPDGATPLPRVVGHYHQLYVMNNADGSPLVVDRVYLPGTVSFAAILDDGTRPTVDYAADGTFSFPIAHEGQWYRFEVSADGTRNEVQSATPQLNLQGLLAGRPDRLPPYPATVQFDYPLSSGFNQPAYIMSTGLFTQTYTGQFGPTVSFDWRLSSLSSGALLGMLEAEQHDALYAVEVETDNSVSGLPFTTIKGLSRSEVTLVPNATITIPPPQDVAKNACMRFAESGTAIGDRIVAAAPRTYATPTGNWYTYLAPDPDRMVTVGAQWVTAAGWAGTKDIDLTASFHDPFVGRALLVESTIAENFAVQLPNTSTPVTYANYTALWDRAARGDPSSCGPATTTLTSKVGLASLPTLDGTLLDTDGQTIALDLSRDVPVTWSLAADGPVDYYGIAVHELTAVNGVTFPISRFAVAVSGKQAALIDRSIFVPGHTYLVVVAASLGRPNAALGDWETASFPLESAGIYSRYFQVQAR